MMFAGLGPKDALTLPRNFAKAGEIATRRSKTGEPVFWPMPGPLAEILDAAPAHAAVTLCANSKGRPWTESGFATSWRTLRLRLEAEGRIGPGLTPYGLRHTVAVIFANVAATSAQSRTHSGKRQSKWRGIMPKARTSKEKCAGL